MENISKHVTYAEATKSNYAIEHGLDNTPNAEQLKCMKNVAEAIFEPLRNYYGQPIGISSFFRSERVNQAIGGAPDSQHVKGQAIDIDGDIFETVTNEEIFEFIKKLDFDQLILEGVGPDGTGGWIHCSYVSSSKNRHEILVMKKVNGKTIYEKYKEQGE